MSQTDTGYRPVDKDYFDRRGLRRYAGVASQAERSAAD